ncbi:polysaccharide deacetylase family protein [Chitinophagaceae bacterium LWZ2-11]
MYLIKTPWWLRMIYPTLTWKMDGDEKVLYLTFDDGPHETATPFVLDTLAQYNAKATFFCIGNNAKEHKDIYDRILKDGHGVGNHTLSHMSGWDNGDYIYIKDIALASQYIQSNLFRPPYGKIAKSQIRKLEHDYAIIMWDVLSGDFDVNITKEKCTDNVIKKAKAGSIVVFHDSTKAWERMSYALPKVLDHFSKLGYKFYAMR